MLRARIDLQAPRAILNHAIERLSQHLQVPVALEHAAHGLVQAHQARHRHQGSPHAVLDREDDIVRDLDELADESEVGAAVRDDGGAVARAAGEELGRDVGHAAGDGDGGGEDGVGGKAQVAEELGEDVGAGAERHGLVDEVAAAGREEAVAPEDLDVVGLVEEVRLVRDYDAHEPVAVAERHERARACLVAGEGLQPLEELGRLERDGEGFPVALGHAGGEVQRAAEMVAVAAEGVPERPSAVRGRFGEPGR